MLRIYYTFSLSQNNEKLQIILQIAFKSNTKINGGLKSGSKIISVKGVLMKKM